VTRAVGEKDDVIGEPQFASDHRTAPGRERDALIHLAVNAPGWLRTQPPEPYALQRTRAIRTAHVWLRPATSHPPNLNATTETDTAAPDTAARHPGARQRRPGRRSAIETIGAMMPAAQSGDGRGKSGRTSSARLNRCRIGRATSCRGPSCCCRGPSCCCRGPSCCCRGPSCCCRGPGCGCRGPRCGCQPGLG
jgi:hypothetical protein